MEEERRRLAVGVRHTAGEEERRIVEGEEHHIAAEGERHTAAEGEARHNPVEEVRRIAVEEEARRIRRELAHRAAAGALRIAGAPRIAEAEERRTAEEAEEVRHILPDCILARTCCRAMFKWQGRLSAVFGFLTVRVASRLCKTYAQGECLA